MKTILPHLESDWITEPLVDKTCKSSTLCYEDETARYCRLACILPQDYDADRTEQTHSVLENMNRELERCGFNFTDTVRTWFYLDCLLEWYDDFNGVRTSFFNEKKIFEKMVPASTGIGKTNPFGAALFGNLLAIQPKNNALQIRSVRSPLQCSAEDYKSSFSRAVELVSSEKRELYISGTASINGKGGSIHQDDPMKQIEWTMQVVTALLESRDLSWENAVRGIAYYTDMSHHSLFLNFCKKNKISTFPLVTLHCDVCRPELLFEMEVDLNSEMKC